MCLPTFMKKQSDQMQTIDVIVGEKKIRLSTDVVRRRRREIMNNH